MADCSHQDKAETLVEIKALAPTKSLADQQEQLQRMRAAQIFKSLHCSETDTFKVKMRPITRVIKL